MLVIIIKLQESVSILSQKYCFHTFLPPPPPLLYFVSLLVCVIAVVWKKLYQFFENSSQNG